MSFTTKFFSMVTDQKHLLYFYQNKIQKFLLCFCQQYGRQKKKRFSNMYARFLVLKNDATVLGVTKNISKKKERRKKIECILKVKKKSVIILLF